MRSLLRLQRRHLSTRKGLDLDLIKQLKEVERRRIEDYTKTHKHAKYIAKGNIWEIPCQVAMPSATQNEINGKDAATLVKNGCIAVGEGANMPTTPEGVKVFLDAKIAYGPGKAANAGGVATSALEMQQNAGRDSWTFEYTEKKLEDIMINIHNNCFETADRVWRTGKLCSWRKHLRLHQGCQRHGCSRPDLILIRNRLPHTKKPGIPAGLFLFSDYTLSYCAVHPPSIGMAVPVIWSAAGEQRKSASWPSCSIETNCCDGCFSASMLRPPASTSTPRACARATICGSISSVLVQPGQMALLVMPEPAVSSATTLVRPTRPCLAAT